MGRLRVREGRRRIAAFVRLSRTLPGGQHAGEDMTTNRLTELCWYQYLEAPVVVTPTIDDRVQLLSSRESGGRDEVHQWFTMVQQFSGLVHRTPSKLRKRDRQVTRRKVLAPTTNLRDIPFLLPTHATHYLPFFSAMDHH